MTPAMDFRREWKHEISPGDLPALRARLRAAMTPDSHGKGGTYRIRSLYFDTPTDRALREKIDGVNRREKFRLRYYDDDLSLIHLEKKSKINGLCRKESAAVTEEEVRALLSGDRSWMAESGRDLVWELREKMTAQLLRPSVIVDYTREAYTYAPGNVRVTLDSNIRTGLKNLDFLRPASLTIPAGAPIILEVKWDEYLPDTVRSAVQLEGRRSSAFSKYAVCRRFD